MTIVTFPRKEIEKHIKLTDEIIEKISLFGTPLERIDKNDLEIEVFPDRPDLISMQGWLRGFLNFLGKTKPKEYKLNKPQKNFKVIITPEVENVRPFTACAIVKNLNFDDFKIKEIIELQEKLHITIGRNRKKAAIGIYPLEKIKLPITYTAKKPQDIKFLPLESKREMTASQILSRHPTGQAYSDLLKGLKKYPIFLDSNKKILSMPPIINSHDVGKITKNTKDVFIECSGFKLPILEKILNIIITTLGDMGGDIYQMNLSFPKKELRKKITPDLKSESMNISIENTNKLLGLNLKESELKDLFTKMGLNYNNKKVNIPAWRTDIIHEVDLIEDIAIAFGFDKLTPEIPNISTVGQEDQKSKFNSKITDILVGLNLLEISTYHLIKQNEAKLFKLSSPLELEDSKSEYKILRPNLLIPALRILAENKDVEYPQNIFEIGNVFNHSNKVESNIMENTNLLIALTPSNFTSAKQYLDYFLNSLDLEYTLKETEHKLLIPGRTGEIFIKSKKIGYLGEMHPLSLNNWNLKMPLAVIELNLDEIYEII